MEKNINYISEDISKGFISKAHQRRIIFEEKVPAYLAKGYKVFDPHLHTSFSNDVLPAENVTPRYLYDKMIRGGWSFITFTDHDTLAAYDELPEGLPGLVRGVEISMKPNIIAGSRDTHTIHVNVYDLDKNQFHDLESMARAGDFYGFVDYLRRKELPYSLNHPTWPEMGEKPNWKLLPSIIKEFDVIEAFNQGRIPKQNQIALGLAQEYGKGFISSSDNHRGNPLKSTLVRGGDFREAWENIKQGNNLIVPHSLGYDTVKNEVNGWIRQYSTMKTEDMKKLYSLDTGVKSLDGYVDLMMNREISRLKTFRLANAIALKALFSVAGKSIADAAYIMPQNHHAEEIMLALSRAGEPKDQAKGEEPYCLPSVPSYAVG